MSQPYTFIYDTSLKLKLDAYLPTTRQSIKDGKVPMFAYFHGGAMVTGSRNDIFVFDWIKTTLPAKGFLVVSADYRLLFPSTPSDIITDVHTLFSYVASPSTPLHTWLSSHHLSLDKDRIIVSGQSGGNYPARAAATIPTILPRPIGWLNIFGQGNDWLSDFWLSPQAVLPYTPFFKYDEAKAEELVEQSGGEVISNSAYVEAGGGIMGDVTGRNNLYLLFAQTGLYADILFSTPGIAAKLRALPYAERHAIIPPHLLAILLPLPAPPSNTDRTTIVPPTYIIHGTSDHMVPIADSYTLQNDLERQGGEVEVDWVEGAEHGLLAEDFRGMVDGFEGVVERVVRWLERRVDV
ncbi:hypothetical protein IAR50_007074 [Cryptococcus sp. DSM 104548]